MIVVVCGTAKEIEEWASRHALSKCDYIRVRKPASLRTFLPGTPYVTVGRWAWEKKTSRASNAAAFCRPDVFEMLVAAESCGLRLDRERAE